MCALTLPVELQLSFGGQEWCVRSQQSQSPGEYVNISLSPQDVQMRKCSHLQLPATIGICHEQ